MKRLLFLFALSACLLAEAFAPPAWAGRPQGDRPLAVLVVEAAMGRVGRRVAATGTLYPVSEVKLMSQAEGQVLEILVREGDQVNQGQLLARLDDRVRQIELALARAELEAERAKQEEAEAIYKSREPLFKTGVVSQQEWIRVLTGAHRAAADVERMRQRVNLLRVQLEYFEIRSPIGGVVTERRMEPGDLAMARSHVLTLAHVRTLRMRAPVSELELSRLRAGQGAVVELDAHPGRRFQGKLTVIFPQVDPRTRQALTEVEIPNPDLKLQPGLHARVSFEPQLGREAIVLPSHAVEWNDDDPASGHVFLLAQALARPPAEGQREAGPQAQRGSPGEAQAQGQRQGQGQGQPQGPRYVAQRRKVGLGESVEGQVEILSGLKAGEKVIVSGVGQLKEGSPVRVVTE
ncbi:MAG: efflux RND transporter periplasmic adaptor subunit [Nitrospinota bacterium]